MVEVIRCKVDICGLQEVRWRGASATLVERKDSTFKLFWVRNDDGMVGVGILLAEKWVEAILMLSVFQIESCYSNLLYEKIL